MGTQKYEKQISAIKLYKCIWPFQRIALAAWKYKLFYPALEICSSQLLLSNKIISCLYVMITGPDQANTRIIKIADHHHGERDSYKINDWHQVVHTAFNAVHKAYQKADKQRYGN